MHFYIDKLLESKINNNNMYILKRILNIFDSHIEHDKKVNKHNKKIIYTSDVYIYIYIYTVHKYIERSREKEMERERG